CAHPQAGRAPHADLERRQGHHHRHVTAGRAFQPRPIEGGHCVPPFLLPQDILPLIDSAATGSSSMQFTGTDAYIADKDLMVAVNAAIPLERPLLVKGEPGTGKTELARQVAAGLGLRFIEWNIKSTTKAQQGLYEYDAVSRLRDSQLGDPRVHDISN